MLFDKYHEKIDFVASSFLLYNILVLFFVQITPMIVNENYRAIVILFVPILFLSEENISYTNRIFHYLFGFRR